MNRQKNKRLTECITHVWKGIVLTGFILVTALPSGAQMNGMSVDLSLIDGIELTQENMFNYRINNTTNQVKQVEVTGRVYYRKSALNFSCKYQITVHPGINNISRAQITGPSWTFSSSGLKDLFTQFNKLPQGTYEYCVTVATRGAGSEAAEESDAACVYQTVEDLFLISLVTPENDAKIYEYNPMLAWIVNYPFASELTYKLRVAELKQGQNAQAAITRNNAMYKDDRVMTTGTVYPVTARPLQKGQPYVWTVDAYYKGVLLGGAEVWKFTIIDDSELVAVPRDQSYYEFEKHYGDTRLNAVGELKLKYVSDLNADTLSLQLLGAHNETIKLQDKELPVVLGDNRILFPIYEKLNLKHKGKYTLLLTRGDRTTFSVPFTYFNPLYIK